MSEYFAAGYVIDFADGGESEEQVLHSGSLEDCERLGDLMPAVAYSGTRPVEGARFVIVPIPADSPLLEPTTDGGDHAA